MITIDDNKNSYKLSIMKLKNNQMQPIQENSVYTLKESQELLKISSSTMMRMVKGGLIRAAKVGKQYRIMGKELLRVLSPEIEDKVGKAYNKARNWIHEGMPES